MLNMSDWVELRYRFKKTETVDNVAQEKIKKEKEYWKKCINKNYCCCEISCQA